MNVEMLLQAVQTAAVVVGIGFAVYETRRYREERNREAAFELLHAFQTAEFARALVLLYRLPDGLTKREIEGRLGEDVYLVNVLAGTWESLGILVHKGEVSLQLVDDFFSGPIVVSWRKMRGYFLDERRETGRETIGEWTQWLAERFADREGGVAPMPAHVEFRDWRPR